MSESDRELLELSAKAAGIEVRKDSHIPSGGIWFSDVDVDKVWSPLLDDGDALRLAVKLQLELTVFRDHVTAFYARGWCDELHKLDPLAATRRAIVRAAAEIGKAMPGEKDSE